MIDPIPKDEIEGICIIPLITDAQENKVYIEITRRQFKDRLKEDISESSLIDKPQRY